MFTIDQIKAAHSKVKSGADFPRYIHDLRILGVQSYVHHVADGAIDYKGKSGFEISGAAKWPSREIAPHGDAVQLKQKLSIHQQGHTDYPTFCQQAAVIGVKAWIVDLVQMTCTYFDRNGNSLLIENIPDQSI